MSSPNSPNNPPDYFLIFTVVIVFFILLVSGIYLLIYYQHPDDSNMAWFSKFTVLGGYMLAGTTVLGLPLDVANGEGYTGCDGYDSQVCGGLDMVLFWDIFFWLVPVWIFVMIPFSYFYYEAEDVNPPPTENTGASDTASIETSEKESNTKGNNNKKKTKRDEKGKAKQDQESTTTKKQKRQLPPKFKRAMCNLLLLLFFVTIIFALTYVFWGHSNVPVRHYSGGTVLNGARPAGVVFRTSPRIYNLGSEVTVLPFSLEQIQDLQPNDKLLMSLVKRDPSLEHLSLDVEPVTFYAGLLTFLGWFLFALFGGVGMAALPTELILLYVHRPKKLNPEDLKEVEEAIQAKVNEMVEIGEKLKLEHNDKAKTNTKASKWARVCPALFQKRSSTLRDFKAAVYILEQDVQEYLAYVAKSEKFNPLYPYLNLAGGVLTSILSGFWVLHIMVYLLPPRPLFPFLNGFFEWFDGWFPLLGVLAVSLFTVYLLICAVKGCFKFGIRFLCFAIHPMKVGGTYMSAFLFNIGLVLVCALPVVQFASVAFADYARFSTIHQIFGVQVEFLDFFHYFFEYNVFYYCILLIALGTFAYLMIMTKRGEGTDGHQLRDRLRAGRIVQPAVDEDDIDDESRLLLGDFSDTSDDSG